MEQLKPKDYTPASIKLPFNEIFVGRERPQMVADWDKAKEIIERLVSEGRDITEVQMGLDGDWGANSMTVWENGNFYEYDCWGSSWWAEPIILVHYKDAMTEAYPVWQMETENA
jgi:hypothetical protein